MKKPLPVRIVEALGWLYVVLAVVIMGVTPFYYLSRGEFPEAAMSGVASLCALALPAALVLALRQGQRAWFVWPHTVIVLVVLMVALAIPAVVAAVVALILLFSPIALLFHPEASHWFQEMSIGGKRDRFGGCVVVVLCVLVVLAGSATYMSRLVESGFAKASEMIIRAQDLHKAMVKNGVCCDVGDARVDPAAYSNSTDFIMALGSMSKDVVPSLGSYTNIWCVVVNPPGDDSFPVLFTANINPSDLFCDAGARRHISFTCPRKWGGECFDFCEKAAVVMRKGGARQIVKGMYSGGLFPLPGEKRAQLEVTYILTPTGRVSSAAFLPHTLRATGRKP